MVPSLAGLPAVSSDWLSVTGDRQAGEEIVVSWRSRNTELF